MKVSENTSVQLDLKTVVAIISITASFVGMYYTLQADIEEAKSLPPIEVTRLEYELKEEWNEDMIMQLKEAVEVFGENKKPSTRIIVKEVKVDKKGRKL
jgi:predicted PP-loop superfamily ATPase